MTSLFNTYTKQSHLRNTELEMANSKNLPDFICRLHLNIHKNNFVLFQLSKLATPNNLKFMAALYDNNIYYLNTDT